MLNVVVVFCKRQMKNVIVIYRNNDAAWSDIMVRHFSSAWLNSLCNYDAKMWMRVYVYENSMIDRIESHRRQHTRRMLMHLCYAYYYYHHWWKWQNGNSKGESPEWMQRHLCNTRSVVVWRWERTGQMATNRQKTQGNITKPNHTFNGLFWHSLFTIFEWKFERPILLDAPWFFSIHINKSCDSWMTHFLHKIWTCVYIGNNESYQRRIIFDGILL